MRPLLVPVALLAVLSGCAGPNGAPSDPPAAEGEAQERLPLDGALASEGDVMRFAAGDVEASMPIEVSFGLTESCTFTGTVCDFARKEVDLTAIVPAEVPVDLTVRFDGQAGFGMRLVYEGTTLVQSSQEWNGGSYQLAASLVRGREGTVGLVVQYYNPSGNDPAGDTFTGVAHAASRGDVVPPYVPAAIELGPGDTIRASGGGLEELVLFGPAGTTLRASAAPFNVTVPAGAPSGTYLVVSDADEAVRLRGPDRPMVARQLEYVRTDPVDLPAGQETTWDMTVENAPLVAGVVLFTKPTADGSAVAAYADQYQVALLNPGNADVLTGGITEQSCIPLVDCGIAVVGYMTLPAYTEMLDERLVPGTYTAKVQLDSGRDMMAYSWALVLA